MMGFARFAGVAALALAITTSAHAAPAVRVADLDLNTTAGQAAFSQRTEQAAKAFCKTRTNPGSITRMGGACIAAVKAEMSDKLEIVQQARRAEGRTYAAR